MSGHHISLRAIRPAYGYIRNCDEHTNFFHPDFDRRYRNSTDSVPKRESRTITAGRELHPALKFFSGANIAIISFGVPQVRQKTLRANKKRTQVCIIESYSYLCSSKESY